MSLATYASDFNKENMENPIQNKRVNMRNKTLKRRENTASTHQSSNVESIMKKIHNNGGDYEDDDELENNFQPVQYPNSAGNERMENGTDESLANSPYQPGPPQLRQDSQQEQMPSGQNQGQEGFTQLPSEYAKQYYQQYVPYFNQSSDDSSPNGANKDELLNKLNQVIYLLEEQQDEKTGRVTEELILYSFLGIFIIFIVDSFARVGKYVR